MTDNTQPEAVMQLADAYADASFDQGLHKRTLDDAPENARSVLAAAVRRQHARIAELEAQLESIGAGGVSGPLMGQPQAPLGGRWYMVTHDGAATLCIDQEDAQAEAVKADRNWPHMGPHRAVQLVEVGTSARGLIDAAQAVIDRWDTPLWKDVEPTAAVIGRLRAAVASEQTSAWGES